MLDFGLNGKSQILNLFVFAIINPKVIDEFIQYFIVLIMLIEAGIFIFWFVKQSVYNVEKEYGNTSSGVGLVEIIIYTLCAVIITSSSLTMTATAMYRTTSLVGMKPFPLTQCTVQVSNLKKSGKHPAMEPITIEQELIAVEQKPSSIVQKFEAVDQSTSYNDYVCDDILNFISRGYREGHSYHGYLPYEIHWWFHTIFLMLGIFLLVIRKYSNWSTLGWTGLYLLSLITASIFSGIVLSSLRLIGSISEDLDKDESSWLIILIILTMLLVWQSIRLTTLRRFDHFKFINFAVLPIALGVLISVIVLFFPGSSVMENTKVLVVFFVFYISVFPVYKAILNRTLALPKE